MQKNSGTYNNISWVIYKTLIKREKIQEIKKWDKEQ